jgi:hypothetical protein
MCVCATCYRGLIYMQAHINKCPALLVRLFCLLSFSQQGIQPQQQQPPLSPYLMHTHTNRQEVLALAALIMMEAEKQPHHNQQPLSLCLIHAHSHKHTTYTHNTHLSTGVFSLFVSGERGHIIMMMQRVARRVSQNSIHILDIEVLQAAALIHIGCLFFYIL